MAEAPEHALLDCRLLIVTGKGGCGKTTVASALALGAARRGKRVALCEMGRDEFCHRLLDPGSRPVGYAGRELHPSLWVFHIDPFEALAEYLGLQTGIQSLVERGLRQPAFQQLLAAAPGWRELITLGKVYHMDRLSRARGIPLYDLIVIDAPASGHGLTFLDVPRIVQSAIRTGPLRRNAGRVEALIRDPERTRLVPVSLAEELPVRETGELVDRVRGDIGVPVDRVVVNRVVPRPFPHPRADLEARLDDPGPNPAFETLPSPGVMARCCAWQRARYERGQHYVRELEKATALPLITLEELPAGIDAPRDLLDMSHVLYGAAVGGDT